MKYTSSLLRLAAQLRRAVFGCAFTKAAPLRFSIALLLAGSAAAARGQSALDGFDPNANGIVRAIVVQPDGRILIGGEFTSLSPNAGAPVPRNRLARLNPNGSLNVFDPDSPLDIFDPNANDTVSVIVVQSDGRILIGGSFTTLSPNGGVPVTRNGIARLNPDGSLDTNFNPNASAVVSAIMVQADGKILAGGSFTSIGGQTRNGIARLDPTTGAADSFNPNASGGFPPASVYTIAVQADGMILAGGSFTSIGGQIRNRIARLDPATGLADSFNPNPNGFTGVQEILVQPDGKILVGGGFSTIGGQTRNCIARLHPGTGAADSFNPNAENTVQAIALQPDGKVLIGGDFGSVGGMTTFMARLDPVTGAPQAAFNPGSNERVFSIAVQADGKILAGGNFTSMRGGHPRNRVARLEIGGRLDQTVNAGEVDGAFATAVQPDGKILVAAGFFSESYLARLNVDGTVDGNFLLSLDGHVNSIALQADGKILVGGEFTTIGGQTRKIIARLNSNGSVDSFNPNANGSGIYSIAVQPDGKILVCGSFTNIGGEARNHIARLDATNGLADSFDPNLNANGGGVSSIAVQADGKILVGGSFTNIGGQARNSIARLNPDGSADSFNPNAIGGGVFSIAVQADGRILVGGLFTNIGGQARTRFARLDATTGAADAFNPNTNANGVVYSIALQADGKVLAGGSFTNIGGAMRNRIARLNPDGSADSFNPNANDGVFSIAVQADGKVLAGGSFTNIGGQARNHFARLSNDTGALQNLVVSQSTITWTRGGSSPQLTHVTFESSTDNLNYTHLGNGIAMGSNWTLTGLNFSTGQNLYIRARGVYRSGNFSSSESIAESVRNVFLIAQPLLSIRLSANRNVVLSWATNFASFSLEAGTNLNTNVWSAVLPEPVVSGTNNVVTNAAGESARFYRLRK